MGYTFQLAARVLLYASSHRQDNTYHGLCYTSHRALAVTRNSSMGPPHEGSIQRPIAPWVNALTTELHLAPTTCQRNQNNICMYLCSVSWDHVKPNAFRHLQVLLHFVLRNGFVEFTWSIRMHVILRCKPADIPRLTCKQGKGVSSYCQQHRTISICRPIYFFVLMLLVRSEHF